jgi:BirA family biotin operon repressor/biotin-[acetyl-CoA-carboxylase] ligase
LNSQQIIGNKLISIDACTSTNDLVKEMIKDRSIENGNILITGFQQSGRGQSDSKWESEDGKNVLCTIYIEPAILKADEQVALNFAISLAVLKATERFVKDKAYVKWPNDIILNRHKIAGVLIESILIGDRIKGSIIGIGLNVNQLKFNTPHATSIALNNEGIVQNLEDVMHHLIQCLNDFFEHLNNRNYDFLKEEYHANLFLRGQQSNFIIDKKNKQGIIIGVDESGRLEVLINGATHFFMNKEITLVL